MDVFVSADMEGITGVAAPADVVREEPAYERGVDLLHGDVNAAVEGACDAGADRVLVNDAHASMRNVDRARLDARADLVRGNTKPRSMMQGLTEAFDVVLLVGYHAMAGTPAAVLNHTMLGHALQELAVDGEPVGELGWGARLAASMGVPVGLVTGDDATVAEATAELDDPETVAVKEGIDRFSAVCRSGSETRPEIREASQRAVERAAHGEMSAPAVPDTPTIAARWATTNQAANAASAPGVDRESGRRTAVSAADYVAAFEASVGMIRAGAAGQDEYYG